MDASSSDGAGDGSVLADSFMPGSNQYADDDDGMVSSGEGDGDGRIDEPLREQDRFLPIANVARIMKNLYPKLAKASERCQHEKRKTINGEDILFAMSTLGFDNYVDPLKVYLQKYRESAKGEKGMPNAILGEATVEELDESYTLSNNILATDQSGQQNVLYATYPGQVTMTQQIF